MRIETLRYILQIAQEQSINKVARQSFLSRQQLSYTLREAEKELGITLFTRTGNHIHIPDTTLPLLHDIRIILDTYDHLLSQIHTPDSHLTGTLRLAVNTNIWSSGIDIPHQFSRRFPEIQLKIHTLPPGEIITAVTENRVDIALFNQVTLDGHDCYAIPSALTFTPATRLPVVLYASQKDPHYSSKPLSLQTIATLPLIDYKPYDSDDTLARRLLSAITLTPRIKYETGDPRLLFTLLEEGRGVFLSSSNQTTQATIQGRPIQTIPIKEKATYTYGLLYHTTALDAPHIRAFHDFFLTYYKKKPAD